MFRFESPYFLIFLIIIPILVLYKNKQNAQLSLFFSSLFNLENLNLLQSKDYKANWGFFIFKYLKYLALALIIIALARPQFGIKKIDIQTEGINIILAIDLSESMAALDFKRKDKVINRLEAVKDVVKDFISKRMGDRIGVVVFGSEAYTQVPLTNDYNIIGFIIDKLEIGMAGKTTAIGDAIGISLKRLENIKSKSNIIILLTDGQSNSGEITPKDATQIAKDKKVKIYTIGVGTKSGKAPFLVKDAFGNDRYVYQQVDIDEDALKSIAQETQGLYFKADETKKLQEVYESIDKLEKTESKIKSFSDYNDYYIYFLILAFILIFLSIIFANTRYLRIP